MTVWQKTEDGDFLLINLTFWIIKTSTDGEVAENIEGMIKVDIKCNRLEPNETRRSVAEIQRLLKQRCASIIKAAAHNNEMAVGYDEITYIMATAMHDHYVNADTIETEEERRNRLSAKLDANKAWFDKWSDE